METASGRDIRKRYPQALVDRAGAFTITGYAVPHTAQAVFSTFLIVPDIDDCPFCGGSGYGPSLEVHMRRPLHRLAEGDRVRLRGSLDFVTDPDTYQTVVLRDAVRLD